MILTKFVSVGAFTSQRRGAVSGHFIKKHHKKEAVTKERLSFVAITPVQNTYPTSAVAA